MPPSIGCMRRAWGSELTRFDIVQRRRATRSLGLHQTRVPSPTCNARALPRDRLHAPPWSCAHRATRARPSDPVAPHPSESPSQSRRSIPLPSPEPPRKAQARRAGQGTPPATPRHTTIPPPSFDVTKRSIPPVSSNKTKKKNQQFEVERRQGKRRKAAPIALASSRFAVSISPTAPFFVLGLRQKIQSEAGGFFGRHAPHSANAMWGSQ